EQDRTNPEVRQKVGQAYRRVAFMQFTLGAYEPAEENFRLALDLQRQLAADFPHEPAYRHDVACTLHHRGTFLANTSRRPKAEAAFREALGPRLRWVEECPDVPFSRESLARPYHTRGNLLAKDKDKGRRAAAEEAYRAAVAIHKKLAADFPGKPEYRQN